MFMLAINALTVDWKTIIGTAGLELGTEHPRVAAACVDREADVLRRGADSCVDVVHSATKNFLQVANSDLFGLSLLQRAAWHAVGLHADDLWLGVDMIDEGKQHEAAEEREQHKAAEGQQHLECHCVRKIVVVRSGCNGW